MRKVALLSVLLAIFTVPAAASSYSNYITAKLGAYIPQHRDMDNYDAGPNIELALGRYFNPNVALDFSLGFFHSEGSVAGIDLGVHGFPILLSIKGLIPHAGGELYALAGGGVYITSFEAVGLGVLVNDKDNALGYQLGIGANFLVADNMFFGLEGKYLWAQPTYKMNGVTSSDVHIDGIQVTVNVGGRF